MSILTPWDSQGNQVADGTGDHVYPTLRGCGGAGYQAGYVLSQQDRQPDAVGVINAIGGNAENGQETEIFPTLTNGTAPGFQNAVAMPAEPTNIVDNVGGQAEYAKASKVNGTLRAGAQGLVAYAVENHPTDSRVNIDESGKCQTLTSRMGTGGGNVPMVMEQTPFCKSGRARSADDATTWKHGKVANTLNTFDQGETRANELVVEGVVPIHDQATRFSGKRGDKTDGKGNGLGVGEPGDPMNTLTSGDRHAVAYGLDRASFNQGQNAKFDFSVSEEQQPTLTARGPGAVAYSFDSTASNSMKSSNPHSGCREVEVAKTLDTTDPNPSKNQGGIAIVEQKSTATIGLNGAQVSPTLISRMSSAVGTTQDNLIVTEKHEGEGHPAMCCTTGSFTQATEEVSPTLMARDWKDPTVVCTNYIVRRLTPTECARLQGFADRWGWIEEKKALTEEEYKFWMEVRNTHARINGKKEQEYTEKQMLTWYNKLWTDSAEYKMWGNGIALPTALYCIQGMAEVLARPKPTTIDGYTTEVVLCDEDPDDWMN